MNDAYFSLQCFFFMHISQILGTVTKRKSVPKDGPKIKVCLFDSVQTQETQDVPFDDDQQPEILCPNLVNEMQEMPPVLHFYSDLHTVPDTFYSTLSSLLEGDLIQAILVSCGITISKESKHHIITLLYTNRWS